METLDVERNFLNFVHFCSNKQSLTEKEDNCSIIRKFHYCLSINSVMGVSIVFFEHLVNHSPTTLESKIRTLSKERLKMTTWYKREIKIRKESATSSLSTRIGDGVPRRIFSRVWCVRARVTTRQTVILEEGGGERDVKTKRVSFTIL